MQLTVLRFLNQISTLTLECIVGCIFDAAGVIMTHEMSKFFCEIVSHMRRNNRERTGAFLFSVIPPCPS